MGVDVGYRIKVINNNIESDIEISEQDNSLNSIFWGSGIKYTNFSIQLSDILTESEIALLKFKEKDEMEMFSKVIPAKQMKEVIDKIHKKTYYPSLKVLRDDIVKLNITTTEDIERKTYRLLKDYLHYYETLTRFKAIIDLAAEQNANIQIFEEYY